ncbi:MAG: TonB-dependent receptor [Candidatus Andeanibacterium colombiense]|uniref:TonB-dependent receptor n=1 Tax=Candidatus Andeanibacterium colombiense TaxID=3121345 RepID=A0AAJ5X817_9SPHN|nr:MAG: TonB-dependent receptor [Sphingomonadaceae bacterium]
MHTGQYRRSSIVGRWLMVGTCMTAMAAFATPVAAQDAAKGGAAKEGAAQVQADDGGIQSIIVTARYVSEDIQSAPMAISAQTGDQLKAANVTNIGNLGAIIPNLYSHPPLAQASGPVIAMRGVQQNQDSFARSPAVGLYVDDVYHATVVGSGLDLTDVDHIEVLRGPQSTLSGNASIGGAIKVYTKDPTGDGSGNIAVTYGSRNLMRATGAFDIGLSPTLSMRVSGNIQRQDGYVDMLDFTCQMRANGTPELAGSFPLGQPDSNMKGCKTGELGGGTIGGGQVKLRWQPTSDIDLMLTGVYNKADLQETPELLVKTTNPYPSNNSLINYYNIQIENQFGVRYDDRFLAPADNRYAVYSTFCRPQLDGVVQQAPYQPTPSGFCYPRTKEQEKTVLSARLKYRLGDNINLTAIAAYAKYRSNFSQAGDESPLGYVLSHFDMYVTQKTGEVRLDGTLFDDKLEWVTGAFLLRYTGTKQGFIGYITNNFNQDDTADIKSQSAFFHLDYHLTDRWRVSGGARYTDGSVHYELDHPPLITADPFDASQGRVDWLISTDYQITDDILFYANAATGSRPQGVTDIVITPQQLSATPAEELISYEAGFKSDFFDRRLRVNLSAFYMDYKKILAGQSGVQCLAELPQATWHPAAADCATLYPSNPDNVPWTITTGTPAKIKGFEWEITAQPIDGLRLDWSGGYNKFVSGVKTQGQPGYLYPGNLRNPKWNMHGAIRYDIETPIGTITPHVDWQWQSKQNFGPCSGSCAPTSDFTINAYSLFNAGIEYQPTDSGWSASLAVTNLTDKFYYYQLFNGTQTNISSPVGPPREVSLTVRRQF